jgi:hypothetical protein
MISAYFDESGTHDGSVAISVAGYSARPEVWISFEKRWLDALGRYGLDHFHMTDFVARKPPFDRLTDPERHELMVSLVACVVDHDLGGVAAVMKRGDFPIAANPALRRRASDPYFLLMMRVLVHLALYAAHTRDRVMFTFDRRKKFTELGGAMHSAMLSVHPWLNQFVADALVFGSTREFVPLQAADLLAWEAYRRGCDFSAKERRSFTLLRPTFGEMIVVSPAELAFYSLDPRLRSAVEEILSDAD